MGEIVARIAVMTRPLWQVLGRLADLGTWVRQRRWLKPCRAISLT
jgi:hypothetical protein